MDREVRIVSYILILLADSNLPTGSFVASSGLESYFKHGFGSPSSGIEATLEFVQNSLESYARSASGFVRDAHEVVVRFVDGERAVRLEDTLAKLGELDSLYEAMTLNHVARRASTAQGIALLTLYTKGFTNPYGLANDANSNSVVNMDNFVVEMKLRIRHGKLNGHLPICWAVLTATLGLPAERSIWLHLFLHARALLSASVRLNAIGPYASQQLLLHSVRPLVDEQVKRCAHLHTGLGEEMKDTADDGDALPASTWPLGEILAARHDLQHSRIFNS
ncbi:urease accessory protein UreF [Dacryopinax primogenitus]|uniref:Urease accessory protein UreF n=1 Tax=Dacryopinax primogenitus (strain DJM 731) TaxID=1858805 RepID=M5GH42_DACPD|nr:urease accessory protein UreF [Dacryopinax primogenitus]EJU06583.1 urease accessory protein UreF [Dacryopinax primogenitus]